MENDIKVFLQDILNELKSVQYVRSEDIPNIDLYMDQVTTFMEEELSGSRRRKEDKLLTKTMINNYAKNNLIPPPYKKKYSKEHVLLLIFIYYFKNIMSISDIHSLLGPIIEQYFGNKEGYNIQDIYNEIFRLEENESAKVLKDLGKKYKEANQTFEEFPEEDREFLHQFSFICMMAYDVYVKKMIIEHMIDEMTEDE